MNTNFPEVRGIGYFSMCGFIKFEKIVLDTNFFTIININRKICSRFVHFNKILYSITKNIKINPSNIMILQKVKLEKSKFQVTLLRFLK